MRLIDSKSISIHILCTSPIIFYSMLVDGGHWEDISMGLNILIIKISSNYLISICLKIMIYVEGCYGICVFVSCLTNLYCFGGFICEDIQSDIGIAVINWLWTYWYIYPSEGALRLLYSL
jgi:hypothetical protein